MASAFAFWPVRSNERSPLPSGERQGEGVALPAELKQSAKHGLGQACRRYAGGYVPVGSGSGIPACARPTIGLPQAMPGRCFIDYGFPNFSKP